MVYSDTVEPRLSGPRLSGLFDYPDFSLVSSFSWILISCDSCENSVAKEIQTEIKLKKEYLIVYNDQSSQWSWAFELVAVM